MRQILIAITFLFLIENSFAQTKGSPIFIGINHTINSKVLEQDREIQIYLPDSYDASKEKYPVLYI